MSDHWNDVAMILDPIYYILKDCDPDGIEFYWTIGGSSQSPRFSSTKEMRVAVKNKTPSGRTDISVRLDAVLAAYRQKLHSHNSHRRERPMNVYIFTDGIWADGGDAEGPVKRMVNVLKRFKLQRSQVGIQFISFGDNAEALKRLEQLDLLGKDPDIGL